MLKKLEQEAVRADLMAVETILASRHKEDDPVGYFQFTQRKTNLEQQLAEIDSRAASNSIAMLFGGGPVVGSRGIAADFSTTIINHMQGLVSAQSASLTGTVGERGPIPQREKSQMLITDVARGSFGFILEDISQSTDSLGPIMENVCGLLGRMGSDDSEKVESAAESVDHRVLVELRNFFSALQSYNATLRLVSDQSTFELTREAIERAAERTKTLQVFEPYNQTVTGRVFTMPESKRFELHPIGGGDVIKGNISTDFIKQMFDENLIASGDFLGKVMNAKLRVRERRFGKGEVHKAYSLVDVQPYEETPSLNAETDPQNQD